MHNSSAKEPCYHVIYRELQCLLYPISRKNWSLEFSGGLSSGILTFQSCDQHAFLTGLLFSGTILIRLSAHDFLRSPSINRINEINNCSSRTFPIWLHFVQAENFAGTTSPTSHFRFPMISTQIPFPTSVFKNWLSSPDNSTIACPTRSSWKKSSSWRLKIPTAYLS